jgi:hypothetical protein
MTMPPLPAAAAWRHHPVQEGFEVAFFRPRPGGLLVEGHTSAVEEGRAWAVSYVLELDARWVTRRARVTGHSTAGRRETLLEGDGAGHWTVDGEPAPHLDGCLDVDLEASAMTNAFPAHRLGLRVGDAASAPAVYVRALGLAVERLEQGYRRLPDADGHTRYAYDSPAADFHCVLVYDAAGLVLDYPGIAKRAQ